MGRGEKLGAAAVVGLIGLVAVSVPAFDMAEDVLVGGNSLFSTLIENSPLATLGVAVLAAAVWLATSDWEATYVGTVARVAMVNVVGVGLLMTLVVLVQLRLQGELQPFIIAADAVVIGALGGVALGVRSAQQRMATDDAAAQRDRFQALFDNVPNPIVGVEFVGDSPVVRAVNPAFTEVFGFDRRTIVGEDLEQYIVPPDQNLDPVDRPLSPQSPSDQDAWDSDVIELETVDGRREFIRLTAPVDRGPARDGYAIYIDVTVQRQRRERLRVLSRTLRHDIRNQLTVINAGTRELLDRLDGEAAEQAEMAVDAVDEIQRMSEQTRRVEQQIAGDSVPGRRELGAVVEDAAAAVRREYPDATVTVTVPEPVYGDVTGAFPAAVEGVVRNGIEHNDQTEPAVEVTIAESLDGEYLDVRVADDGPGIDPEEVEIVERSGQIDQTTHLDGLGLWTARWVLQNSGGDLEFTSNTPRGTVVTLRVPRSDGQSVPAAGADGAATDRG